MKYIVYKPSGFLADYIKCIWTFEDATDTGEKCCDVLIPSGCVEIVFHLNNEAIYEVENTGSYIRTLSCIAGQRTKRTKYNSNLNRGVLAVMLHPASANVILNMPAGLIFNSVSDAENIWGKNGKDIIEQIAQAKSTSERFFIAESFLRHKIINSKYKPDDSITEYVKLVSLSGGNITINNLSEKLNTSKRNLERKVMETTGISPKEFTRIVRFQKALAVKQRFKDISSTELAYRCGYSDQSHLIKEFKSITGYTPGKYFSLTDAFSDYYSYL